MSEQDLAALRKIYVNARQAWEDAKNARAQAAADLLTAESARNSADAEFVDHMERAKRRSTGPKSVPWCAEDYARAVAIFEDAQKKSDEAIAWEKETAVEEQRALRQLISVLPAKDPAAP